VGEFHWYRRRLGAAAKALYDDRKGTVSPAAVTGAEKSRPVDLRRQRRRRQHSCWDHLIAAPLWVAHQANLGTLLRTCDAVGACLAVPGTAIAAGADVKVLQRMLGHASAALTLDRYGHLMPGQARTVAEQLDAMARRAVPTRPGSVVVLPTGAIG